MNNTPNSYPAPTPEPAAPANFRNTLPGLQEPEASTYAPQLVTQALERYVGHKLDRPERSSELVSAYAAEAAGDEGAVRRLVETKRGDQEFRRFGAVASGNERTVQFQPVRPEATATDTVVTPGTLFPPQSGVLNAGEVARRPHPVTLNRARRAVSRAATSRPAAPQAPHQQPASPQEQAFAQARANFLNAPEGHARNMAKLALREANLNRLEARKQAPAVPAPRPKQTEKFDWFGNAF